ncbi:reverse transcriptase domain-containing protein [Tanacetum coccineum]
MIAKDGTVFKFPGYTPSKEEEEPKKKGSKEAPGKGPNYEFLSYAVSDSDSDLESTARSGPNYNELADTCEKMALNRQSGNDDNQNPDIASIITQQLQNILPQIVTQVTNNVNNENANGGGGNGNGGNNGCSYKGFMACNPKEYDGKGVQARGHEAAKGMSWTNFKALLVEDFYPSNEMGKLENDFWNHKTVRANHADNTNQFHELAKPVPHLVTPESSRIKRYIAGLAPAIWVMLQAIQPTTIQSAILRAGILTDKAVSCGTLTKGNEKRKEVDETSKPGGSWKDNNEIFKQFTLQCN